jgi:hypothetical protein
LTFIIPIDIKPKGGCVREKTQKFLLEFKEIASQNGIILIHRHDTLSTLEYLGLTKANLEEILLGLSIDEYCEGPEPDHNGIGEIWVFGKNMKGVEVYIKLKIINPGAVKGISFHIPKNPLNYRLKGTDILPRLEEGES